MKRYLPTLSAVGFPSPISCSFE